MHSHSHNRANNIKTALILNLTFTLIEIAGGWWTNSLAILSDALHDFSDTIALLVSWLAEKKSHQPADNKCTYGYQRLSLFAALFAAVVLMFGSLFILYQAIPRLLDPQHTKASGMFGLAVLGIVINGVGLWRLKQGQSQNEKILSWHLMEDVLGWVVILIGSVIIWVWDNHVVDPVMTIGFTLFVLWGVARNLNNTFSIFMQAVPAHINLPQVRQALQQIPGVVDVHDIHIWSLEGETDVFSGHVVVEPSLLNHARQTKQTIKQVLAQHHIEHSTIELEQPQHCSGIECQAVCQT